MSRRRRTVTPPYITVRDLRKAAGLTLNQACALFERETGHPMSRGTMSAIETGQRGASTETLQALSVIYGSELMTDYTPRQAAL